MTNRELRFSERYAKKPNRETIQINGMDERLRIALYNSCHMVLEALWKEYDGFNYQQCVGERIACYLWCNLYYRAIDEFPYDSYHFLEFLKGEILQGDWLSVYDLVESLVSKASDYNSSISDYFNGILERELSGYRFVENKLVPISEQVEIDALEESAAISDKYSGARVHLSQALDSLSDRDNPDYRNTVKEAISAVESVVAAMEAHDTKPKFGELVNRLKSEKGLHPALAEAWKKMYGYTSDADGIRHASIDGESQVDFKMAKYMLVTCSAFVNYLVQLDSEESGE